ncbi:MAG: hypothetical protein HFE33_06745 [Clostridia bacterium]|jgi:hypothetical protein|nr:hypothetical protein [Clostridia bacterium]MCI9291181.1 hypothetical protein [Clostridia bacterium]
MWDNILELAISDGLWALLFCVLLIYQLKDSKVREVKYQDTISSLAKDLEYMKELDESIEGMERNFKDYTEELISKLCEEKIGETLKDDATQLTKEGV